MLLHTSVFRSKNAEIIRVVSELMQHSTCLACSMVCGGIKGAGMRLYAIHSTVCSHTVPVVAM